VVEANASFGKVAVEEVGPEDRLTRSTQGEMSVSQELGESLSALQINSRSASPKNASKDSDALPRSAKPMLPTGLSRASNSDDGEGGKPDGAKAVVDDDKSGEEQVLEYKNEQAGLGKLGIALGDTVAMGERRTGQCKFFNAQKVLAFGSHLSKSLNG
jgi:hypothetical protein